jgi:hypothetical protein
MESLHKTKNASPDRMVLFIIALAFIITTPTFIFAPHPYIDNAWCLSLLLLLGYFVRNNKINNTSAILLSIAILMHMAGVFGLYSKFVFGVLGFDKLLHLFATFAITFSLLDYLKQMKFKTVFAPLIALGAASTIEISEFIGTYYFGINAGGILAIGDNLPEVRSALQTYDIYFDLIFNITGALLAVFVYWILNKYISHNYHRIRDKQRIEFWRFKK